MHRQYHLRCWTRFFAPAEEVWAAKTDLTRLNEERLPFFRIAEESPGALTRALQADLGRQAVSVSLRPFGWMPGPSLSMDVEIEGRWRVVERLGENPFFHDWEHRRTLEQASDACRYLDAITFTPKAPTTRLVARFVEEMFIHAHYQCARAFETDDRATAVAMLRLVPAEGERWTED